MNETRDIEAASGLTVDEIQARLLVTVTGEDAAFIRRVVEENKALRELLRTSVGCHDYLIECIGALGGNASSCSKNEEARQSLDSLQRKEN